MAGREESFRRETASDEPVWVGDVLVKPQSEAVTVRWSGGGWVWNRPVAVLVERGEEEDRIPIVDITRVAQLWLYGLSLVFAILGLIMWMTGRSRSDD